jgi:hypothetical protein
MRPAFGTDSMGAGMGAAADGRARSATPRNTDCSAEKCIAIGIQSSAGKWGEESKMDCESRDRIRDGRGRVVRREVVV